MNRARTTGCRLVNGRLRCCATSRSASRWAGRTGATQCTTPPVCDDESSSPHVVVALIAGVLVAEVSSVGAANGDDVQHMAPLRRVAARRVGVAGLVPLVPARLLETRAGLATADGLFGGGGRVGPGVVEVDVVGRGGVPSSGVAAVMVNVTAVNALGRGFATVFPCGEQPTASALNYSGAVPATANEVLAKVSDAGTVCVFVWSATHLLMDVTGYLAEPAGGLVGEGLVPLVPARLLETRAGLATADGLFAGGGRVGPGVVEVDVVGRGGVPSSGVAAVMVNVTAVNALGRGFATVFPCGEQPTASALNYSGSVPATANEVLAKVSDAGTVCVFVWSATHLLMDVTGYLAEPAGGLVGEGLVPLVPARLLETRAGLATADGLFAGGGRVGPGVVEVDVVGRGGVPSSGVAAVMVNVTAVNALGRGFATVFPCGEQPTASALNYSGSVPATANEVLAKVSEAGTVCVFVWSATHLLMDVTGYLGEALDPEPTATIETLHRAGWFIEPEAVTFTANGQTGDFELVHYGADGPPVVRCRAACRCSVRPDLHRHPARGGVSSQRLRHHRQRGVRRVGAG